ncbi:MAG TPA: Mpo1-like protein [Burkholderiales bacterium]|nr:Mpo1-like protein [Burkholderiales bacterium]
MSGKRTDDQVKSLDEQMAIYAAYHRNRWNRLTHFIGVPAIVFAILIPMSWVPLGAGVTLAHVFLGVVLAYYLLLDFPLGLATGVMSFALLYTAELAAGSGVGSGWIWFGAFFVGGWIFQLAGHAFEGRRPALADNLFQIFVAPIFLVAEVFFALGLKRDVLKKVEARLAEMSPAK